MNTLFGCYMRDYAEVLEERFSSPQWREVVASGLPERLARRRPVPPEGNSPAEVAVDYLCSHNGHVVRKLIADGERDEEVLLDRLSRWPETYAQSPCPITFLGLCLTYACNAQPKCVYCNQCPTPELLADGDWRRVIEDAAKNPPQGGTFIYMTGGEPLLLGNRLYGEGGLIEFATRLGCAVNLNTNGLLITPEVALRIVGSGLARLHLSLDSADPDVHDALAGASGRHAAVLQALMDLQIARELLGANHPVIHINCVLTKYNAFGFPRLLEKLLRMKRVRSPGASGPWRADPHFRDLGVHLIPVGGAENAGRRLSRNEVVRFYLLTWLEAASVWEQYQDEVGVPPDERLDFGNWAFFASAYHRVRHRGSLEDYAIACEDGEYGRLALMSRCYIVPTQGFVLPDGSQYWCGAHSVARPKPLGNVKTGGVSQNIAANLPELERLPGPHCRNCATATLFLNQTIELNLRTRIGLWLKEAEEIGKTLTNDQLGFE